MNDGDNDNNVDENSKVDKIVTAMRKTMDSAEKKTQH